MLVVCIISGVLMLDKYSLGEFGISQPLVSASVLGFAAGDFTSGVLLGVLLQPLWLVELPIGRKVPLDAQAAGISGAAVFFSMRLLASPPLESALLVSILVAAAASWWGGWLDVWSRKINEKLAMRMERATQKRHLLFIHVAALEVSFLRGMALAAFAVLIGAAVLPLLSLVPLIPVQRLLAATLSIGLAGGLVLFGLKKRLIPAVVGFAAWVVVWVLVRF